MTLSDQSKSRMDEWEARCAAAHAVEMARGLHDEQCEYGKRATNGSILMLCHCSKRKREASGFTEAPTDDLEFPPPRCTHCHDELCHDGDCWQCYSCSLSWASDGRGGACFTDEYGSIEVLYSDPTPKVLQ